MLTRSSHPRSGRPSQDGSVVMSANDRLRSASSAPDSRTIPCRHAGSGTKRGSREGRITTSPRGATGTATPGPSRSKVSADDQSGGGNSSVFVFVLDRHQQPLMPCHPARARELLTKGRAVVVRLHPFTIRLTDRTGGERQRVVLAIDPGSKITGFAVARQDGETRHALWLGELQHRGAQLRKKMQQRRNYRCRRRSANLRYRAARFLNRRRPDGWLPPSLQHRVDTTRTWVQRLQRYVPITQMAMELVRFDTQALQDPDITGIEYQQGTPFGYEVREYLLEKWGRQCVYCKKVDLALQIEHILPTSRGGTNRISNLTLACHDCNQKKGNRTASEFGHPAVQAQAQRPLKDAAAVNTTRQALYVALHSLGLPLETATGGRTKWNRNRLTLPKTHAIDALCVGTVETVRHWSLAALTIMATGRGAYQRTQVTTSGFPRSFRMRHKTVQGFRTGDLVNAVVSKGAHAGIYTGRVAVRATGRFNIKTATSTIQGIPHQWCWLLMRADGYSYVTNSARRKDAPHSRPK